MPLTHTAIRAAKAHAKAVKLFDGGGLYLEVSPGGGKWWRWKYRYGGKEKRLSLGVYPHVSLKAAREKHDAVRQQLASGIDPGHTRNAEKLVQAGAESFEALFRYAVATGRAERDSTTDLRGALPSSKEKHHASITEPKRIGELLRAIHSYEGYFATKCALRLASLVFVRPGELRQAQWLEIDLEKAE